MSELKTNKISTNDQNNVAIDNALGLKSYTTAQRDALTSVAGDTIYNSDDSKVQVYTGSAWEDLGGVDAFSLEYLIIAGGGGGGGARDNGGHGGGGGAGGYLCNVLGETSGGGDTLPPIFIGKGDTYEVSVGAGGTGAAAGQNNGTSGSVSYINSIYATGGGWGSGYSRASAITGGSGGGAGWASTPSSGLANQGFDGGVYGNYGTNYADRSGGAGGGASAAGGSGGTGGSSGTAGNGGNGLASSITGSSVTRAGGGGGGGNVGGSGGTGGGGAGANVNNNGSAATVNTGSGGGAGASSSASYAGGNGGSGVVILRWATADATIGATRTGLTDGGVQTDGTDSYIVFTEGTGNITFS